MKSLLEAREKCGFSQRELAAKAGVAFRSVQLLEWGEHDPRLSTLKKLANPLGYPPQIVDRYLDDMFKLPPDSIAVISEWILEQGESSWKTWLFNFVDAFRADPNKELIALPPAPGISVRMQALLASTVEAMSAEKELPFPPWCQACESLPDPWFVSGMESLKAMALLESPVYFRKRNIFVLGNFLDRA